MVKKRSAKILALAIGAILFLWAGLVVACENAGKVPFTATEYTQTPTDYGTMTFPDGYYHVRDQVIPFIWESDEPRLDGTVTVIINMNLDSTPGSVLISSGPMWGTFNFPIDGDSGWDGVWHGQVFDAVKNILEHSGVGYGYGQFEGLQMEYSCTHTGTPLYVGSCTGRILEPDRKHRAKATHRK